MALLEAEIKQIKNRRARQPRQKRKMPKPNKWQRPKAIERRFMKFYKDLFRELSKLIEDRIFPRLGEFVERAKENRPDSADIRIDQSWQEDLRNLMNAIMQSFSQRTDNIENDIKKFGKDIDSFNKTQFNDVISSVLGVTININEPWQEEELNGFIRQNTRLIKKLEESTYTDIERVLITNISDGTPQNEIKQIVRRQSSSSQRRAELIARDQTAKLNGKLTNLRQREAGITEFIWETAGDERVRDLHAERDGVKYKWSEPPDGEIPGEPPLCRCVAVPVMDEIFNETTPET